MILIFDTETTGFVNKDRNPDHPSQPHLVQLSMLLYTPAAERVASFTAIIKPDGYEIPDAAAKVHGVTTALALERGIPIKAALQAFVGFSGAAKVMVAHNLQFDVDVMEIALTRYQGRPVSLPREAARFCTMMAACQITKIPHAGKPRPGNRDAYKWPKLSECMEHFFGEEFVGHTADADCEATARLYFELRKQGAA